MKQIIISMSLFVCLFFMATTQAAIYKCVDANNEVTYNDKPCSVGQEESQIKNAKDPIDGYNPLKDDSKEE